VWGYKFLISRMSECYMCCVCMCILCPSILFLRFNIDLDDMSDLGEGVFVVFL